MRRRALNICVANGPWQIMVLVAAVHMATAKALLNDHEDYVLVLYENSGDKGLHRYMELLAEGLFPWREIHWIPATTEYQLPNNQWPYSVRERVQELRRTVGCDRCERLWLCHLHGEMHQYFMEAYRTAAIFLYEDGLQTCIESPVFLDTWRNHQLTDLLKWFLRGRCRDALASARLDNWRVSRSNADRVRASFIYATEGLGCPLPGGGYATLLIPESEMRSTIQQAKWLSKKAGILKHEIAPGTCTGLFVCQAFYLSEIIAYDAELAVYRQVLEELASYGWEQIDWKDHPKNPRPFLKELRHSVKGLRVSAFPGVQVVPIELHDGIHSYHGCFSASSTAMFTIKKTTDVPVYTMARQLMDPMMPSAETRKLGIAHKCFPDYMASTGALQDKGRL